MRVLSQQIDMITQVANALGDLVNDSLAVKIIAPVYYVATKIEAYLGRGKGDLLSSHDIEDIITIFDGRSEIVDEILKASSHVRSYISEQLIDFMKDNSFEYVIQSVARNDKQREDQIIERIENCLSDITN